MRYTDTKINKIKNALAEGTLTIGEIATKYNVSIPAVGYYRRAMQAGKTAKKAVGKPRKTTVTFPVGTETTPYAVQVVAQENNMTISELLRYASIGRAVVNLVAPATV